jgi:hypothetical protein
VFDLAQSEEQLLLCASLRSLLKRWCDSAAVRAAEPTGHDPALWQRVAELGLAEMALPVTKMSGAETTVLDVALTCEVLGEFVAPVPLVDVVVSTRLLSRLPGERSVALLSGIIDSGQVSTVAVRPPDGRRLTQVSSGSVATSVIYRDGDKIHATRDAVPAVIPNMGSLPLADRDTTGSDLLAEGSAAIAAFDTAIAERKALVAAQLVGLARRAMRLAVEYATERSAFGVKIASFQALSHRMADMATYVAGAELLSRKAAWAHDQLASESQRLSSMALIFATEAANVVSKEALHLFGGYGFMLEYDIQLYFRRAKAWPLIFGPPALEPEFLAELMTSPITTGGQ